MRGFISKNNDLLNLLFAKCPEHKSSNLRYRGEDSEYTIIEEVKKDLDRLKESAPNALVHIYANPRDVLSVTKTGVSNALTVSNKLICFGTAKTCHDKVYDYQGEDSPHSYSIDYYIGSISFECMDH